MGLFSNVSDGDTLGFLGGIGSSLIGYAASRDANSKSIDAVREQNRGNMELAQYQYEKNLEAWNMQNDYNSPASQIARFKAAGLNPNLIYGSGSGNSGNASSYPQYTAPRLAAYTDFSNEASAVSGLMDQALKAAQVYKTEQETSNLRQYQKNLVSENQLKELEIIGKRYANSKTKAEADIWKEILQTKLNLLGSEELVNTYRGMGLNLDNMLKEKYGSEEYESRIDLLHENKLHSEADRALNTYRALQLASQANLSNASAYRIFNLTPAEKKSLEKANDLKDIEIFIQNRARDFGINPNNNSEIGSVANIIIALYGDYLKKIKDKHHDLIDFGIEKLKSLF